MKKNLFCLMFILGIFVFSCSKDEILLSDSVAETGNSTSVNEDVLVLDNSNSEEINFNENTGELCFSYQESTVETNNILVIDLDTAGLIRKVTSVSNISGIYTCQTEQATLEDVFSDASFKLSTEIIETESSLKSTMSNEEISKTLTDANNFIHPVSVTYKTSNGNLLKDAITGEFGDEFYTLIDFSGLEIYEDSYVNLYISEGYAELAPSFKFDFDFDDGIQKFKFWSDSSKFDFKTMLTLDVSEGYELDIDEILFSDVINVSFKFMAGAIPVYIEFDCDIHGHYEMSASGALSASTGYQATRYATFGVNYEDDEWSTFDSYEKEDTFYPFEIEGNVNLTQRLELYPRFTIELYEVVGAYADIIPFLYNENNVDIVTSAWDSKIDLGMDARIGAYIEILGIDILSYDSENWNIFTYNLWNSPDTVELVSGNNQSGTVNQQLEEPIVLKVTDNFGLPVPLVRVDLEIVSGNGSFENITLWSDEEGLVTFYWTLGDIEGEQIAKAILLKADGTDIPGSPIKFSAIAED